VAHPLGMLGRVLDCGRAASAGTDQGEALERGRVDYAFEIAHTRLERKIADVAVRQSAAADVVAQDLVFAGKNIKPGTPGKTSPLVLKVGDPGRRHHQRGTCATDRIRQAHAIRRRTETYTLIHHPRPVDPTEAYHLGGWGALHQHAPFRPRDREGGSPDPRPDDCSCAKAEVTARRQ